MKNKRIPEFRVIRNWTVQEEQTLISNASLARDFWQSTVANHGWFDPLKECVALLCLNRKNRIVSWNLVSMGTETSCLTSPREILRAALVAGGTAFILAHNHPSGDPSPSSADMEVTRAIRDAAKTVEMPMVDHVIIGSPLFDPMNKGYYSFRDAGFI